MAGINSVSVVPSSPDDVVNAEFLYELVACEVLPGFNPTVTIKHALFNAKQIKIYNSIVRPFRRILLLLYAIGFILRTIALFSSAPLGRIIAPSTFFLQMPIIINSFLFFRYDYVKILVKTFDIWLTFANVLIWFICIASALQDARIWILPTCCFDFINAFLMESFFTVPHRVFFTALSTMGFLGLGIVYVMLGKMDQMHYLVLISTQHHTLTTRDLIVYSMFTIFMLFTRLAYNMHTALRRLRKGSTRTQSISFRCRVKLQHQRSPDHVLIRSRHGVDSVRSSTKTRSLLIPMRLSSKYSKSFDVRRTVVPWIANTRLRDWHRRLLYSIGVIGGLSGFIALILWNHSAANYRYYLARVALSCSLVFSMWFFCCAQRQLLYQLVTNFHFAFLSSQITMAILCACDVLYWDTDACYTFLGVWVWMHRVMMLDTLSPFSRRQLAFSMSLSIGLIWILAVLGMIVASEVMLWNHSHLQDRAVWVTQITGQEIKLRVVPFVFNRQITILVWCTKLLWRSWTRHDDDELILLHGIVEFDAPISRSPRNRRHAATIASISPHVAELQPSLY